MGDDFDELRREMEEPGVQILGIKTCPLCGAHDIDVVFLADFGSGSREPVRVRARPRCDLDALDDPHSTLD